jgi:hypothetical protein
MVFTFALFFVLGIFEFPVGDFSVLFLDRPGKPIFITKSQIFSRSSGFWNILA